MNADQINELRDLFRRSMLDWDVSVSVKVMDVIVYVSFDLWQTRLEGSFYLSDNQWAENFDCPHYITNRESVWQWIAMQLHAKLTA